VIQIIRSEVVEQLADNSGLQDLFNSQNVFAKLLSEFRPEDMAGDAQEQDMNAEQHEAVVDVNYAVDDVFESLKQQEIIQKQADGSEGRAFAQDTDEQFAEAMSYYQDKQKKLRDALSSE